MRRRHGVLALLCLLSAITYVDRVCISVAGKTIQDDLGLTPSQWGWVLGSFALAYCLFEIPTGALGDRIGPRKVLTRIVVWWSGFTALTGLVTGFWQMLTTRFMFGVGEAGAYPNSSAAIARWFPFAQRAQAQGFVWMASRVGGAFTPLLVIPVQQAFGWRASFYMFGTIGIVWAIVWYTWCRDDPAKMRGVSQEELAELGERRVENTGHSFPWKKALREPNMRWILVMYFAYCWSGFFYLSWLHSFLENGRGFSKADLIAWSWVPFAFGGCANLLGGWASDRLVKRIGLKWGRRSIGIFGLAASAVFLGAAFVTQDKVATIFFLALGYAGSDFMLPVAWAVCLDIGGNHSGALTGAMNMAGQAGSFSTSVAFGYIVAGTGSWNTPLLPIVVMTAFAALAWLKIDPTRPLTSDP